MGSSSPGAFVIQFTPELVLQLAEEDGGKVPKRRPSKPKPKPRPMSPKSKPEQLPPPGVPPMFGMLPRSGLPGYQHPPFHHAVPPVPPRGATEIEDEKPEAEHRKEEPQKKDEAASSDEFRREENVSESKEEEESRHEAPKAKPEAIPHKVEDKEDVQFEKKHDSKFRQLDEEQPHHSVVVARDLQPLMKILEKTEKYSEELQKRGLGELEEMKQRAQELQHKQYMPVSKTVPCSVEREACIKCYKEKDALQCRAAVEALKRCTLEALRG